AWAGDAPEYADDLAVIRLKILERQGKTQEYLHLAEAEGRTQEYVVKLAQLARIPEAVSYALKYITVPAEFLALAGTLKDLGSIQEGLRVAEHGLGLDGHKVELAAWTRDEALRAGQTALALRAARIAFSSSLTLADYKAVQSLSGDNWPSLREELLQDLRSDKSTYRGQAVDIFIHEDLIDDAIAKVEAGHSYYLIKVADAAIATRPDWVIATCKRQAEAIIDAAKAKYYEEAVQWLDRVQSASEASGRGDDFQAYLQSVMSEHSRKRNLMPMLARLRGKR
ncbi:MAG: SWIM zinc finger domain-containing protein, partial [Armatimonadota bacterium]|nr:SWIM zinc finger domain-containing protein [Armatimonadota bacterium]